MSCVNVDWTNIMKYTENELSTIQMKLNTTFDSILNDLTLLSSESQKYIELRLQDHVVSIADQQRQIARMHRQLSAANELIKPRQENSHKKIIIMIVFGIFIGMVYERFIQKFIRPRVLRVTT